MQTLQQLSTDELVAAYADAYDPGSLVAIYRELWRRGCERLLLVLLDR